MSHSSPEEILQIQAVGYAYGGFWAVDDCSFAIQRGRVTGLIGPNGAGKSTLIELISGFLRPQRGRITYDGVTICRGPEAAARMGIARTFQIARLFPRLSVLENVMIGATGQAGENPFLAVFRRGSWQKDEETLRAEARDLLGWLGLDGHLHDPAGSLSGGQRRLLELARAMMAKPTLLLLDEPTAGVFPETTRLIASRVRDIAEKGITVLLIAHNMEFLSSVADDVVVMAEGKVLARGSLEYLREHEEVVAAYLGGGSRRRDIEQRS